MYTIRELFADFSVTEYSSFDGHGGGGGAEETLFSLGDTSLVETVSLCR